MSVACLEVAGVVDEDVFRLEVTVDDVERVQILERQHHLTGVERRIRLASPTATTSRYSNDSERSHRIAAAWRPC